MMRLRLRLATALALLPLLAACGGAAPVAWDGRRGYDGRGDYGYDLAASRAEAGAYRALARPAYSVPGPPEDPWGPHIREAATRFALPESWLREVMRQESGFRLYGADGLPITSPVGAMGLMQVMPATYDRLRPALGLGPDPYEPRDNILAGAAYLRAMYDRFGAPLFLAAYNAGPDRVANYLSGAQILPDETEHYVARIAPRIGYAALRTDVLAAPQPDVLAAPRPADPLDRAYADGGLVAGGWAPPPACPAGYV
ncbi:lytic transglycosylase domain-containing protein, partial [Teichococcus cervicalis]